MRLAHVNDGVQIVTARRARCERPICAVLFTHRVSSDAPIAAHDTWDGWADDPRCRFPELAESFSIQFGTKLDTKVGREYRKPQVITALFLLAPLDLLHSICSDAAFLGAKLSAARHLPYTKAPAIGTEASGLLLSVSAAVLTLPLDDHIGVAHMRCAASRACDLDAQYPGIVVRFTFEIRVSIWHRKRPPIRNSDDSTICGWQVDGLAGPLPLLRLPEQHGFLELGRNAALQHEAVYLRWLFRRVLGDCCLHQWAGRFFPQQAVCDEQIGSFLHALKPDTSPLSDVEQ